MIPILKFKKKGRLYKPMLITVTPEGEIKCDSYCFLNF